MPDTAFYYRVAYVAAALLYGLYTLSLVRRIRSAARRPAPHEVSTAAPGTDA